MVLLKYTIMAVREEKMLKKEIINLIELKQEGTYWDFKREWYSKNQKADLLHDIICMANNLQSKDAYIIIGINEENNYEVDCVLEDSNRWNTQKLVDFLKDKKFVGDVRPLVYVEPVDTLDGTIDVIVIKNSDNTPYYLRENYRNVAANNIYTRVIDTNTPKNKSADIIHVEYLWRKRFRLLSPPLEQIHYYLKKSEDWIDSPTNYETKKKYNKYHPEFSIEYTLEDNGSAYQYYLFNQTDIRPHWNEIRIYYHQTLLFTCEGINLDGGRYFTPVPETSGISIGSISKWDIIFKYFIKNTLLHEIHEFYYVPDGDEADTSHNRFMECVLLFDSKEELENFKEYVLVNWNRSNINREDIWTPNFPNIEGYHMEEFKKEYIDVQILQKMLIQFKKSE